MKAFPNPDIMWNGMGFLEIIQKLNGLNASPATWLRAGLVFCPWQKMPRYLFGATAEEFVASGKAVVIPMYEEDDFEDCDDVIREWDYDLDDFESHRRLLEHAYPGDLVRVMDCGQEIGETVVIGAPGHPIKIKIKKFARDGRWIAEVVSHSGWHRAEAFPGREVGEYE